MRKTKYLSSFQHLTLANKYFFHNVVIFFLVASAVGIFFHAGLLNSLMRGIWTDEALSIYFVQGTWHSLFVTMRYFEANMGLYYVVLKIWGWLGGWSEIWLRSLSMIFFLGALVIIYLGIKKFTDRKSALQTVLLLLTHYFLVRYSVEIRSYSLALLLLSAGWYFWLNLYVLGDRRFLIPYLVSGSLAGYAHFFTLLGFGTLGLIALFITLQKRHWWRFFIPHTGMLVSWSPLIIFILTRNKGQLAWVKPVHLHDLIYMAYMYTGAAPQLNDHIKQITLILVFFLVIASFIHHLKIKNKHVLSMRGYYEFSLFALTILPLFIGFVISYKTPVFVDRFYLMFVPFFVTFIVFTLNNYFRTTHGLILFTLLLVIFSAGSISYEARGSEPWKKISNNIFKYCHESQTVVFMMPFTQVAFNYYHSQRAPTNCDIKIAPFKLGYAHPKISISQDSRNPKTLPSDMLSSKKIWLITSHLKSAARKRKISYWSQVRAKTGSCSKSKNYFGIKLRLCE